MDEQRIDPEYIGQLVTEVIEWCMSSSPDWFDDTFVHSVYMQFQERGTLTPRQVESLEKIADKFIS